MRSQHKQVNPLPEFRHPDTVQRAQEGHALLKAKLACERMKAFLVRAASRHQQTHGAPPLPHQFDSLYQVSNPFSKLQSRYTSNGQIRALALAVHWLCQCGAHDPGDDMHRPLVVQAATYPLRSSLAGHDHAAHQIQGNPEIL